MSVAEVGYDVNPREEFLNEEGGGRELVRLVEEGDPLMSQGLQEVQLQTGLFLFVGGREHLHSEETVVVAANTTPNSRKSSSTELVHHFVFFDL